ncbi:hypothetical protein ACE3MZ_06600 [Paenibacillus sp. WLX1005]|uniref:hypothetical protein n=1 Tax=Paenibacillus sp. WLX1005 TaxID=3243766 RepID=UPI003983FBCF
MMKSPYEDQLNRLAKQQQELIHIHSLYDYYFPIVIAVDEQLWIHEYDKEYQHYQLTRLLSDHIGIPDGCLAAFPLKELNGHMSAVLTPVVFTEMKNTIFLYHEFVHCYMYEYTRHNIYRNQLALCIRAESEGCIDWEISYDFPYEQPFFVSKMTVLLKALRRKDWQEICTIRTELMKCLSEEQRDYWLWLEWNEGYARYIENLIRSYYKMEQNNEGSNQPYDRLTFYYSGELYIRLLIEQYPEWHEDMDKIYLYVQEQRQYVEEEYHARIDSALDTTNHSGRK